MGRPQSEIHVNGHNPLIMVVLPLRRYPQTFGVRPIQDRVSYIPENNLLPLCQILANLANYRFDDWDSSAIANGINGTDNEKGVRFEYLLEGTDFIRLSISHESGTGMVHVQATFPDHLIGRVETALDIASEFGLSTDRWGTTRGNET